MHTIRKPDFSNLLSILDCKKPSRPTLFEMFLNDRINAKVTGETVPAGTNRLSSMRMWVHGFHKTGYDYATVAAWHLRTLSFPAGERHGSESVSLNEGAVICDRGNSDRFYFWGGLFGTISFIENEKYKE